jgi:hypothetical protein
MHMSDGGETASVTGRARNCDTEWDKSEKGIHRKTPIDHKRGNAKYNKEPPLWAIWVHLRSF